MTTRPIRIAGAVLALGLTVSGLAACGEDTPDTGGTGTAAGGGEAKKIALLLPENKTARYEAFDKPMFEAAVKAGCPNCEVLYSNANQDAAKQQQQAEAAITQGAE
jgi:D-xylose transport system substrate-binding protein